VAAAAQGLSVLTVSQEPLLKPVMAVLALAILLLDLLFITRVVAAGAVLMLADCCLTPALAEQAAAGMAGLDRAVLELTELQILAAGRVALRRAVQHPHRAGLVWLLSLAQLLRFQPQVLRQLPTQAVSTATSLLATVRSHSKVKYGTFCKAK
jgi:hypothetical protein